MDCGNYRSPFQSIIVQMWKKKCFVENFLGIGIVFFHIFVNRISSYEKALSN